MTALGATLTHTLSVLGWSGVRSALIGGLAVSVRTEPRFTRDIDLAVAVADDAEAEELVRAVVGRGFLLDTLIEQEATGRLATVRLRPSASDANVVDLLFASSGIENDIVDAADVLEVLPGVQLPVARTGHLIALKLLARDDLIRPQDAGDLRALVAAADAEQLQLAAHACSSIMERGYGRDRDLRALLDATRRL